MLVEDAHIVAAPEGGQEEKTTQAFLAERLGEPEASLEILMARDGQILRKAARGQQDRARCRRQRMLQKALEKTEAGYGARLGHRILNFTLEVVQMACAASGTKNAAVEAIEKINNTVQPMGQIAEQCQLDAEAARNRAQVLGDEASDANQWLSRIRDVEQRMLRRLEDLERSRHEGHMRAAGPLR